MSGKHRKPRASAEAIARSELARAEAALHEAKQEKEIARVQSTWRDRLKEGWDRVHERNNLAGLFTEDYRRIH